MTFSANPARSRNTLRDRLRRLTGSGRALLNLFVTSLLLVVAGAVLVFFLVRAVVSEQAAQFGGALAAESAQRAAEYLVHNDLVSLSVITTSLSRLPGVVGVTVYDRHRQPLAQSGLVQPTPDILVTTADILTEENELRGTVEILIDPKASSPALARFDYALFGWVGFATLLLVFVTRLQRDDADAAVAEAPANANQAATLPLSAAIRDDSDSAPAADAATDDPAADESPLAHLPDGQILRIDIVNFTTLEQRVAPHLLEEMIAFYGDLLARACAFYQGQVTRPLNHQCLVTFPPSGGTEEEVLFRAVCCAQLFFGVVRETNPMRRAQGRMTLQFTAAIHHDPMLTSASRAIVSWEICTQAGTAGRLTVTDALTEHPTLGERLVLDSGHRHVLQIEMASDDPENPRLQDVLAQGVLKLAEPYEELLARQVKRLSEPAAA